MTPFQCPHKYTKVSRMYTLKIISNFESKLTLKLPEFGVGTTKR